MEPSRRNPGLVTQFTRIAPHARLHPGYTNFRIRPLRRKKMPHFTAFSGLKHISFILDTWQGIDSTKMLAIAGNSSSDYLRLKTLYYSV